MKRLATTLLVLAAAAFAQPRRSFYTVEVGGTLSAATQVITIQLPTAQTTVRIGFTTLQIYSSAACDWRTERDGALATGSSAVTPSKVNSYDTAAVFEAYSSSNVGTANRNLVTYKQLSGLFSIDLQPVELLPGETLTIRTPSNCSADYRISVGVIQTTY